MRHVILKNALAISLLFAAAAGQAARAQYDPSPTPTSVPTATPSDPIIARWHPIEDGGTVEVYLCKTGICARVACNGDEEDKSLCGMRFLKGLQREGEGQYVSGLITDIRGFFQITSPVNLAFAGSDVLILQGRKAGFSWTRTWRRAAPAVVPEVR